MPTTKDYYDILGVSRTASDKEIKAAYRRLARKYHPDLNKNDKQAEDKFKELSEAFAVLSDADKRARYDRGGHEAFGPGFDPFAGADPSQFDFGFGDLSDLFGGMFGGARAAGRRGRARRSGARPGADLRVELRVPFLTAATGGTVDIVVPVQAACPVCSGTGTRPGSAETTCPQCQGTGRTEQRRGSMTVSLTCPRCHGAGRLPGEPCTACAGSGKSADQERLTVRIPSGIDDGETLRLAGKGNAGTGGGPAGDAYLTVHVEPHPRFRREGRDLYADVAVGIARAALGGQVEVETLDGKATITLPPGTPSGRKLRLRGRGIPAARGKEAGDLYAVIQIRPPERLDERSRKLLAEFDELNPDPR
jgi:molecular chaperone DnaJ